MMQKKHNSKITETIKVRKKTMNRTEREELVNLKPDYILWVPVGGFNINSGHQRLEDF